MYWDITNIELLEHLKLKVTFFVIYLRKIRSLILCRALKDRGAHGRKTASVSVNQIGLV